MTDPSPEPIPAESAESAESAEPEKLTESAESAAPAELTPDGPTRVRIRRAPKLRVFVVLGGLAGFLVTLFATGAFPADPKVGFVALLAYFCLYGVTAGVLLGAVVGIVADRLSVRRQHTVIVERERYEEPEPQYPDETAPETAAQTGTESPPE